MAAHDDDDDDDGSAWTWPASNPLLLAVCLSLSLARSILLSSTFLAFSNRFRFSFFLMVSILLRCYPVQNRGNQLQRKESGSLSRALWKLHLPFFLCRCIRFYICFSSGPAFTSVNDFMNLLLGLFEFHLIPSPHLLNDSYQQGALS